MLLRVPSTASRTNQSILKEINPEYVVEGLMLKLKLQYFGHLMRKTDSLEKTLMLGKLEGRRIRVTTEDEMVGWHHWLYGHEFQQFWELVMNREAWRAAVHCKESDMTKELNWTELISVLKMSIRWCWHLMKVSGPLIPQWKPGSFQ